MKTLDVMAIPLSQGLYALIDGEDFERLSKYKWYALKIDNTFYAARNMGKWPNRKKILMHRFIMNAQPGEEIDHQGHYGLDNRKMNLRFCTTTQNAQNQRPYRNTSCNFKGVSWHKQSKKWQARIINKGRPIHLGCFNDEIEAAKVYDQKAKELFGEFAYTNF